MSCPTFHKIALAQSSSSHSFNPDVINAFFPSNIIKRLSHACTAAPISDKQKAVITVDKYEIHILQPVVTFFQDDTSDLYLSTVASTKWSSWVTTQETDGNRKVEQVRPAKGRHSETSKVQR